MKMTRHDLKGIIKECLIEILSEGLTSTQTSINESRAQRAQIPRPQTQQQDARTARSITADKISFLPKKEEIRNANPVNPVTRSQNLARSITSDPVLADIFADTARSGMYTRMNESASSSNHEQMIASAGDAAAKAMLRSDPMDIFGDSAEKWASLAFADKLPARS